MSLIVVLYLPASLADPVKVSVVKTAQGLSTFEGWRALRRQGCRFFSGRYEFFG